MLCSAKDVKGFNRGFPGHFGRDALRVRESEFAFNLRFPGQYYDVETGTHYNYFRDYGPATGRYIESDPIGLKGGLNTYLYARANPLSRMDPSGLENEKLCYMQVCWINWKLSGPGRCHYDCPYGRDILIVKPPYLPCMLFIVDRGDGAKG